MVGRNWVLTSYFTRQKLNPRATNLVGLPLCRRLALVFVVAPFDFKYVKIEETFLPTRKQRRPRGPINYVILRCRSKGNLDFTLTQKDGQRRRKATKYPTFFSDVIYGPNDPEVQIFSLPTTKLNMVALVGPTWVHVRSFQTWLFFQINHNWWPENLRIEHNSMRKCILYTGRTSSMKSSNGNTLMEGLMPRLAESPIDRMIRSPHPTARRARRIHIVQHIRKTYLELKFTHKVKGCVA